MAKINRPSIENPLAGMGLDDIVRGITNPVKPSTEEIVEEELTDGGVESVSESEKTTKPAAPAKEEAPKPSRQRRNSTKAFDEYLQKYTGISEQGIAIWLPKEVKKRLEMIRINASRNIPLRSLAAAIIMTYISENEERLEDL